MEHQLKGRILVSSPAKIRQFVLPEGSKSITVELDNHTKVMVYTNWERPEETCVVVSPADVLYELEPVSFSTARAQLFASTKARRKPDVPTYLYPQENDDRGDRA